MAAIPDRNFSAAARRLDATLATVHRLLDFSDFEWVRNEAGPRAAARLRKEHRAAFFVYVSALDGLAREIRHEASLTRAFPLERVIQFDAETRWLLLRLRVFGCLAFAGLPGLDEAVRTVRRFQAILSPFAAAPSVQPSRS